MAARIAMHGHIAISLRANFIRNAFLGGRFGYFLFFLLGEGKGESEAPGRGRGSVFFIENARRMGGGSPGGGGGDFGVGGWAQFFFSGPKVPPRFFLKLRNLLRKRSKVIFKMFEHLFGWWKKTLQISRQNSPRKTKKKHRSASAGEWGERFQGATENHYYDRLLKMD